MAAVATHIKVPSTLHLNPAVAMATPAARSPGSLTRRERCHCPEMSETFIASRT
ncbi:uncharacterized protein V6R79_008221 [Siganus canaliculatus]